MYLAGERSLGDAMIVSLKDMYRARPASGPNVIAQFQPRHSAPLRFTIADGEKGSRRMEDRLLESGPLTVTDRRIARLGETIEVARSPVPDLIDGGPPRTTTNRAVLEDFIVSGITQHESDHYFVVLSGHASGVVGKRIDRDGFSPSATKCLDLGLMFESVRTRTGRLVDVLGMDACFMGMSEVCWELRNSVRFLVASEGLVPEAGWPYDRLVEVLRGESGLGPAEAASKLVGMYLRYNSDFVLSERSIDLSACRLDRSERLAAAVGHLRDVLVSRLCDPVVRDRVVLAHWSAQSYKSEEYVDLWDFCDLLQKGCEVGAIGNACEDVKRTIENPTDGMALRSVYSGPAYQHSHGLSIYFPWSEVSPGYRKWGFARATRWHQFLGQCVRATRRRMRGELDEARGGPPARSPRHPAH